MSNFKANLESLKNFSSDLRRLPKVAGAKVAEQAAPAITSAAQTTFSAGQDPYGIGWAPGIHGQRVTLYKSGRLARYVRYVAIGTKLRVVLGVPYAKYQIGKRPVFPRQGGALPLSYVRTLTSVTESVCRAELGVAQ